MTDPAYIAKRLDIPVATRDVILRLLSQGFPIKACAEAAGISHVTLHRWRESSPEFDAQVRAARGEIVLASIQKVIGSDDWRAHSWYLSKTVDDFRDKPAADSQQPEPELPAASEADVEAVLRGDK